MHGKARLVAELIIRLIVLVRRCLPDLLRLSQFPARFRQFSTAVEHTHCLPVCRNPALRRPDRAVHHRADRQRLPQRIRPLRNRTSRSIRRRSAHPDRRSCYERLGYPRAHDGVLSDFRLSRRAGAICAAWRRVCRRDCWRTFRFASIIQKVFDGVDNEALLAIPFFLLVGELMSSANVVVRIANLSMALVGHMRGGLSQVVTVFSMFFSGNVRLDDGRRRGDEPCACAGPMKKEGYEGPFIAAIIAAASTIAALVPPSITAVVYGATGNVSIAGLFMAGFVPGLDDRPRTDDLLLLLRTGRFQAAARVVRRMIALAVARRGPAAHDSGDPARRHSDRLVHANRSRRRRRCYGSSSSVIPALNPRHLWNLPYDFCLAGLIFSLPLITIGAANAFGYLLAYLRGRDRHLRMDHRHCRHTIRILSCC